MASQSHVFSMGRFFTSTNSMAVSPRVYLSTVTAWGALFELTPILRHIRVRAVVVHRSVDPSVIRRGMIVCAQAWRAYRLWSRLSFRGWYINYDDDDDDDGGMGNKFDGGRRPLLIRWGSSAHDSETFEVWGTIEALDWNICLVNIFLWRWSDTFVEHWKRILTVHIKKLKTIITPRSSEQLFFNSQSNN